MYASCPNVKMLCSLYVVLTVDEMDHVKFIDHNGGKICYLDFSGLNREELIENIGKAENLIASQPLNSVLTLTNVTNTKFDTDTTDRIKQLTAHNKPYVKKGAVVGVTGMQKIVYKAVIKFSKRDLSLFDNVDDAKDWLIQ